MSEYKQELSVLIWSLTRRCVPCSEHKFLAIGNTAELMPNYDDCASGIASGGSGPVGMLI